MLASLDRYQSFHRCQRTLDLARIAKLLGKPTNAPNAMGKVPRFAQSVDMKPIVSDAMAMVG